jgi:hypothetical protein
MKKIFFLVLLLGNLVYIFGQADFEDKERERNSKNKVKKQIQWEYDYVNGVPTTNGYKCSSTTYDKNGNPLEVTNYDAKGKITSVLLYTFDANNNKTSYSRFKGSKEQLSYNQTITYDGKGNKIAESGFDGSSPFNNIFKYNASGKLQEISYTSDKVLSEKRAFKYNGTITEMSIISPANVVLSKEISVVDNKNNVLEETKYVQDNVAQKSNYSYDPNGKKVEESKESYGKLVYRRKYTYNASGQIVQITEEKPGSAPFITYQYLYDSNGNVFEEKWTKDPAKEYSKKTHKYDVKGLLKETTFYNATYKMSVLFVYTYESY